MSWCSNLKLITMFSVAFSLASLAGVMASSFHGPTLQLGRAIPESPQFWYPAGPEMNTELVTIFTDQTAEYTNLQSATPSIDFSDYPLDPSLIGTFTTSPNFLITASIWQVGYYEIQFMLANNFWGCNFNFGNSACGVQIRQGIAHMIDKTLFTTDEPSIAGYAMPIDNAVPTTSLGGLPSPNPGGYDVSFPQTGTGDVVGASGGTAYRLALAIGANGTPWLQAPGSADLNAAAQHFVNAGVATGFNPSTSVLTGISSAAATNAVNVFIRNDDPPRLSFGNTLEEQICYLFTGSYNVPCTYLSVTRGPNTAFPGFTTSTTSVIPDWWMYTAAYSGPTFFDGSLYSTYNSRFVSGVPPIQAPSGSCSPQSVPTASAADYMYLCSPTYDSLSYQMETSPGLTAPGDPAIGAVSNLPTPPGNGIVPGTSRLSAISAGIQAEAIFGANVFTLPIFERTAQFGYLNNGWTRAINSNSVGLPNYFTWLNAWNPSPAQPGTIRQGFSQTTRSVNPYIASTVQDLYIVRNVFDSLSIPNPLAPSQLIDWMTMSIQQLPNSSLTYPAPARTLTTYRFTLRPDLFFQDGRPVTSYDVAFSYLSMVGTGAILGTGASTMSGVTILNPHQFDIGVSSLGPFELPNLTGIPIVSGRYWTNAGASSWDSAVSACTTSTCALAQYTLSGPNVVCAGACTIFPATTLTINPVYVAATFDPIANRIFVGSGPWQCGTVTSNGSGDCTSGGAENPPVGGSYTLTRFGRGLTPVNGVYFRSPSTLALCIWASGYDYGACNFNNPILVFSWVAACYGLPVAIPGPCDHWQQGIGNPGTGTMVGVAQVSIVSRFYNVNWVAPFDWTTNPPTGIGPFPPVLYEGSVTLNPASVVGNPGGYDSYEPGY